MACFCVTTFHLRPVKINNVSGCRAATVPALTPIMDKARPSYSGRFRKLVVALDIGTTFSGAAYALLDPGKVPQIRSVTRQVLPPTLIL